jgi:predicted enzyme related to lactoylglutathione lyase
MIEYPAGTPSWVDLSSPDLDASARFYGELFGWDAVEGENPEQTGGYRMFKLGGQDVAGLGPTQEGAPPAWNTYIAVDDAAGAQQQVEAAGGTTVLPPMAVMDAGTMAIFTDSGGAFFGVWQAGEHRGSQVVNAVGGLTMNELDTRDFDAAGRFYGEAFGWQVEPVEQDGALMYGSAMLGGRLVAGVLPMGENFPPEVPPHWVPYFGVEDLDAATAKAEELGARVMAGPIEVPQGRFVSLLDPHGAHFSMWEGQFDPPPGG